MEIIVAVIIIIVVGVLAMYLSLQKKAPVEENSMPIIHTSGIYSVLRKSPRMDVAKAKPSINDLKAFVASQNKDASGSPISEEDKEEAIANYSVSLEESISAVEEGDKQGVQRFEIMTGQESLPCKKFSEKRYFITREDIYRHPELLPPYYPGCTCRLLPELENIFGPEIVHLPGESGGFPLPDWKNIVKVS